jgi:hypothetical protein
VLLFIVLVACYFIYTTNDADKLFDEAEKQFPSLNNSDSVNSIVIEIYCPPSPIVRCASKSYIITEMKKFSINNKYDLSKKVSLNSLLSAGDSLVKRSNCDTLYLYDHEQTVDFLFVIK